MLGQLTQWPAPEKLFTPHTQVLFGKSSFLIFVYLIAKTVSFNWGGGEQKFKVIVDYTENSRTGTCLVRKVDQKEGSGNKGTCWQAQQPEFNPWTHILEGKNRLSKVVLWLWHMCQGTYMPTHMHIHMYIIKIIKEKRREKERQAMELGAL